LAATAFSALGEIAHTRSSDSFAAAPAAAAHDGTSSSARDYGYVVDKLFRSARTSAADTGADAAKIETNHIVANAVVAGEFPDADRRYLAELVAAHAGVPQADAEHRVDDFVASAFAIEKRAIGDADAARKAASKAAIFAALSMLVGAFIASVSAALGGRLRDEQI
jgi:hypothetical protein